MAAHGIVAHSMATNGTSSEQARRTRLRTARPATTRYQTTRDWLLLPAFQQHGADMLTAEDIAHISMASTWHKHSAPDYVRTAMRRQHGVCLLDGATAADLYAMERVPDETTIDLRRSDAVRADRGSPFATCYVGGHKDLVTLAQMPPSCGDAWSAHVCLKRGRYVLECSGWLNPAHGILDISLDGAQVGAGLDWCGARTAEHSHVLELLVKHTGPHVLSGKCCRSSSARDRRTRFWICLASIRLKRMGAESLRGATAARVPFERAA